MAWNFQARRKSYVEIWEPVALGVWTIWATIKDTICRGAYGDLFNYTKITNGASHMWFSTLSANFFRFEEQMTAIPLLVSHASGVVLELGPGTGNQLSRYDKDKVTRIVGVEYNPYFVEDLERKIEEQGMRDIYELIIAGAQDSDVLEKRGIVAGSVDTVLSIQVLCAVPDVNDMAKEIYRLLKPGGKFIFAEHQRNKDWLTGIVQRLWNPFWRPVVGCSLTRDIRAAVGAAGEWENLEALEQDGAPESMLPRVWGELIKKKSG